MASKMISIFVLCAALSQDAAAQGYGNAMARFIHAGIIYRRPSAAKQSPRIAPANMKLSKSEGLNRMTPPELESYVSKQSLPLPEILGAVEQEIAGSGMPTMQVTQHQAQVLHFLVHLLRPKHILEVGTYFGYSALAMASALAPDARLTTLERSEKPARAAQEFFDKAGLSSKITLVLGESMTFIDQCAEHEFDFIFVDAEKRKYAAYLEKLLPKLTDTGLMVFDNTLFRGEVLESNKSKISAAIDHFNRVINQNPEIHVLMLPLGDGFTLIQKSSQTTAVLNTFAKLEDEAQGNKVAYQSLRARVEMLSQASVKDSQDGFGFGVVAGLLASVGLAASAGVAASGRFGNINRQR